MDKHLVSAIDAAVAGFPESEVVLDVPLRNPLFRVDLPCSWKNH